MKTVPPKIAFPLLIACLAVGAGCRSAYMPTARPVASLSAAQADAPAAPPEAGHALLDQAISRDTRITGKNPKDTKAWIELGNALMQKARETADLSYYGHAEAVFKKALALDGRDAGALTGMAWVTSDRHEFEASKAWAGRALALDPGDSDAYGLIGDADQEIGDYDAAYAHYQKMLDLRPDLASYSRGGHLLWLTGDAHHAGVRLMVKAIDAGGPYAETTGWCRAQLGLMLYSEGRQAAAEQTLRDALLTTPNNYRVLMALGRVEAGRGDYQDAIGRYEKAIAVVPQLESVAALGDLYALTGRKDDAQRQFALAGQIDRLQKANGVKGGWQMALFQASHDRDLLQALEAAREEYRTRRNVYVADALAWCLYKNGRYAEAKVASDRALSRKTPEASFFYHAGMIDVKLGDRLRAGRELYQALNLNPNFSPPDAPVAVATLRQIGSHPPSHHLTVQNDTR